MTKIELAVGVTAWSIQSVFSYWMKKRTKSDIDTKLAELNSELADLRVEVGRLKYTSYLF
jgi:hypothetical protein